MSSDVILDTASCLPYRRHLVFVPSSSRPRYVIISYRIPDDIKTQSITCDTGYDDIRFARPSPRLISSLLLLPAPLPATPCCPTGRLKARRHPASYSLARLACLLISFHLIGSSHRLIRSARCLPALSAARRRHPYFAPMRLINLVHLIRPASSHRVHLSSRPASRSASRRASRLTSRHVSSTLLANLIRLVHLINLIRLIGSSPTPHRIRRAGSRRNGARNRQSTMGSRAPRHPTPHRYRKCLSPPAV